MLRARRAYYSVGSLRNRDSDRHIARSAQVVSNQPWNPKRRWYLWRSNEATSLEKLAALIRRRPHLDGRLSIIIQPERS
jgi:hypothetical protein